MKSKAVILIEYLWLGIALLSLAAGIHQWYNSSDIKNSSVFLIMVFISLLMFSFRRYLRKNKKKKK